MVPGMDAPGKQGGYRFAYTLEWAFGTISNNSAVGFRKKTVAPGYLWRVFPMLPENKVYEVLKMLRPHDIDIRKVRIGGPWDGGYILADRLTSDQVVLSYGLGGEVSFDAEMAARGHQCYMFDHTIQGLGRTHPNFHFFREGVSGATEPEKSCFTVQDHLERFKISGDRLILKMDVEGAEWDAISRMPDAVISRFEQIAIEMHDFYHLAEPEFLEKAHAALARITRYFTLFHVHANNNNPMQTVSGFSIYNLLEFSFIKSDIVARKPSRTLYPTDLDNPNEQDRDDYILSIFPFWPAGLSDEEYDAHARTCKLKSDLIVKSTLLYKDFAKHGQASGLEQFEAFARESLRTNPGLVAARDALVKALNMKAVGCYNGRRFGDAVVALREALALAPGNPDLQRNLDASLSAQSAASLR